jgi:glycine/D-amino acid oxidase-like deaminating enzyme
MIRTSSLRAALKPAYDVVIVGGGVVGLSSAYHIAKKLGSGASVCVVEKDASYKQASAVLSAGGIRQQFSGIENIKMSLYGLDFIRNTEQLQVDPKDGPPDMQFDEGGYLFLGGKQHESIMRENNATQRAAGCDWIDLHGREGLAERFPWMDVDGGETPITLGSYGHKNEGWFDPWSLISGLKKKCLQMGVTVVEGNVTGFEASAAAASASSSSAPSLDAVLLNGGEQRIGAGTVVNAAGAWAHPVVRLAAEAACLPVALADAFPVRPRPRCIFMFNCKEPSLQNCPLMVDTNGVYVRREGRGGNFICGVSPSAADDCDAADDWDMSHVDHALFEDHIWPTIASRVPAFEQIKLQSFWSGLYEFNTLDQNAIIDRHPAFANLVLCNGFSGHGLQQSPAAGRAVGELVVDGCFTTLDLGCFGYGRVERGEPLFEKAIV